MSVRELSPPEASDMAAHDMVSTMKPTPRKLSLRSNFAWAFAGNTIYAICQWGMIVALAKFGNAFMIGQFSLGLAIVTPVLMLSSLGLRAVQATDSCREYYFAEYLRLRLASTVLAIAVIAAVVWFGRYERGTAAVILAVAVAKGVETLSDIHYGLFQLNDRLDQTGRSMILRGVLAVAALAGGLYLVHNVFWACMGMALVWLAALLLYDVRHGRSLVACTETRSGADQGGPMRQARLMYLALPLGIVTTVASINLHMPRYFIHARLGEQQLGIFSALAYATVSLTLVGDSLGNSAIPRLSRLHASGKLAEYRGLLLRLLAAGSAIGLLALALARGMGAWILRVFYNADYAVYSRVFTLLMAGAAIHFAASMLTAGITSARCFRVQVPLYVLVAACTAWGCALWVPSMGLAGAALGVIFGAVMRLLLAGAILALPATGGFRPKLFGA
jgi:O-antigen/teichoic acid export membrane protein